MTLKCMFRYFVEYPDAVKLEKLRNICEFTEKIPA